MANREIFRMQEQDWNGETISEGFYNVLSIQRSAAGPPTILITIEDWENGMKWGEGTITIRDTQELINVLQEWVDRDRS